MNSTSYRSRAKYLEETDQHEQLHEHAGSVHPHTLHEQARGTCSVWGDL